MNSLSPESLKTIERASGYRDLSMFDDALEELDSLSEPDRSHPESILFRAEILNSLKQYDRTIDLLLLHEDTCAHQSKWFILMAYAKRRARGLPQARAILSDGLIKFPKDWLIHYNIACYHCQLHNPAFALVHLLEAVKLNPTCRLLASQDSDFDPLKNHPAFIKILTHETK